jgi:HPt (histidine-containing phosphotransfer) domain-containing protein
VVAAQEAREALPGDVQQSLRVAFAAEVASRLPHLRLPDDPEQARHDAHTLASSAWVVGEQDISVLARAVEFELEDGREPRDLPALVTALESFVP